MSKQQDREGLEKLAKQVRSKAIKDLLATTPEVYSEIKKHMENGLYGEESVLSAAQMATIQRSLQEAEVVACVALGIVYEAHGIV